jgi:hypothetical protein
MPESTLSSSQGLRIWPLASPETAGLRQEETPANEGRYSEHQRPEPVECDEKDGSLPASEKTALNRVNVKGTVPRDFS